MNRLNRFFERYTLLGKKIRRANKELLHEVEKNEIEVLWLDTAYWIYQETLEILHKRGVFLINYTTDAFFPLNRKLFLSRRLMRKTIKFFDVLITTNAVDYERFSLDRDYDGIELILSQNGYDSSRFKESEDFLNANENLKHELVFIGHHEPETERKIIEIVKADLPIVVYGNHHWFSSRAAKVLKDNLKPALNSKDYECALRQASIALCFVSHWNYNTTAGRSFEITRSGTFLLAEKTSEHLNCFKEGKEAEFFDDEKELIEKIKFYLNEPKKREEIAYKGLLRCKNSAYSWEDNIQRDWLKVKEIINKK